MLSLMYKFFIHLMEKAIMSLKQVSALALFALSATGTVLAETAPAAPESSLSYNVGAVTEYRYRGLSQSRKAPALQAGVDYTDKSGAYIGSWASTISWIKDSTNPSTTKGPLEVDIYGGYKGSLTETVSYDLGLLQYWYAGNNLGNTAGFANANTLEFYGALSYGPLTAKYSQSTTNLFGYTNSKGSSYLDVSATFDLGDGLSLVPHIGKQAVKNYGTASYTDYALALNKDMDGLVLSATLVGTNFKNRNGFIYALPQNPGKDLGASTLVLGIKKNF
jgi:uncharacterized protein (TIGR02001 family)